MLKQMPAMSDWFLNQWVSTIEHVETTLDPKVRDVGRQMTVLFDNAVDTLRNPQQMPNLAINKLATLFWRLVGNRVTPSAMTEVPTLSFWAEMKRNSSIGIVMVPWGWPKMCLEDRWMQLGGIVFVASQAADYYNQKMSTVSDKPVVERARAYESEYLIMLYKQTQGKEPHLHWTPNPYQENIMKHFPYGLQSLPSELRYDLAPYKGNSDFTILETGLVVPGRNPT